MIGLIIIFSAVLISSIQILRAFLPQRWKLYLALKTQRLLPRRFRVWMLGSKACNKCK